MEELNLKRVNVLGIDVCDLLPEEGAALSFESMLNSELNTAFFLTVMSSIYCQENPWAADLINSFRLVFPGDRHTEMAVRQEAPAGENSLGRFAPEYLKLFFINLNKEYRQIFVAAPSRNQLDALFSFIKRKYPGIRLSGMAFEKNQGGAGEKLVNEINAHTPDALLFILPPESMLTFLRDYESMMNAGLCICIDSLGPMITEETRPVPSWIRFLHLESLYRWMFKEEKLRSRISVNLFRKKITEDTMTEHVEDDHTSR